MSRFIPVATVKKDDDGKRCDKLFRLIFPEMPLSSLHKEIRNGNIRVNGKKVKQDDHLCEGDTVEASRFLSQFARERKKEHKGPGLNKESFRKRVVFEDDSIIVICKRKGELVHQAGGEKNFSTLDRLVRQYLDYDESSSISFAPGPLHRLDRNTSGIIAFGKTAEGARKFSVLLQGREVRKCYIALMEGPLKQEAHWHDRIVRNEEKNISVVYPLSHREGDEAVTDAYPILCSGGRTLAMVEIGTGRTHQIRAQASRHGFPLTGDVKYRGGRNQAGYYLHSAGIAAEENIFTAAPDSSFVSETAELMRCSPSEVKKAINDILSLFAEKYTV